MHGAGDPPTDDSDLCEPPRRVRRLRLLRLRPPVGRVLTVVDLLVLDWCQVVAGAVQAAVVVPVDPLQDGQLDVVQAPPGPTPNSPIWGSSDVSVVERWMWGLWVSAWRSLR